MWSTVEWSWCLRPLVQGHPPHALSVCRPHQFPRGAERFYSLFGSRETNVDGCGPQGGTQRPRGILVRRIEPLDQWERAGSRLRPPRTCESGWRCEWPPPGSLALVQGCRRSPPGGFCLEWSAGGSCRSKPGTCRHPGWRSWQSPERTRAVKWHLFQLHWQWGQKWRWHSSAIFWSLLKIKRFST